MHCREGRGGEPDWLHPSTRPLRVSRSTTNEPLHPESGGDAWHAGPDRPEYPPVLDRRLRFCFSHSTPCTENKNPGAASPPPRDRPHVHIVIIPKPEPTPKLTPIRCRATISRILFR